MSYVDKIRAKTSNAATSKTGDHDHPKGAIKIFVDGSFNPADKKAGWGWVAINDRQLEVARQWGNVDDKYGSRNITGECASAYFALKWAKEKGLNRVIIVHDYIGLGKWGAGEWKTNAAVSRDYVESIKPYVLGVEFRHIRGHEGNKWNEVADQLAEAGKTGKGFEKFQLDGILGSYDENYSKMKRQIKKDAWRSIEL